MMHLSAQRADDYGMHGVTFRSFARSATGATQVGAWQAEFAPETPGEPHRMSVEEVLRVLSGQLRVEIDEEALDVVAGEAVVVPAGALLRVSNTTLEPAAAWVVTPLGMTVTMEADGARFAPPWAQ